ncbi:MAG: Tetratricopeptide TPR_2 repeat protein [Candidatus Magasanikbacteria bacterium GW2011_GWA2_46_17]|uniref:Tetratricopeptide TPR_2 repeat protein n=1 Tax=Candidatus Magasanikbacteria bacterium GW2011_GWA2_46_17 TaxID=1619042 RepID=A0A0G1P344_9BACT|nr:MAG: Tetratricopeptide TPR_2 repeat protein [Candidatus Magasanikbacteria bacterium GW2011_GWA2_46_17]
MPKLSRKIQLRRCNICKRAGHNKATCPKNAREMTAPTAPPKSASAPIRFFVHHVPYSAHQSSHLVDLKKDEETVWKNVKAVEPSQSQDNDYYFFHERKKNNNPTPPARKSISIFSEPKKLTFNSETSESITHPRPIRTIASPCAALARNAKKLFSDANKKLQKTLGTLRFISNQHLSPKRLLPIMAFFVLVAVVPTQANSYYQSLKSASAKVADSSTAGFLALQESTAAILRGNLPTAQNSLQNALQNFDQAVSVIKKKHRVLQSIVSSLPVLGNEVESRQNLILAGQELSLGNAYLVKGIAESQNANNSLTARVKILTNHLKAAAPNYQKALQNMDAVDADTLPFEYQLAFKSFKTLFSAFLNDLKNISELGEPIQEIFGARGLRRYLLVFQNPHELRPTGGFMGSFGILEIKDGAIQRLEVPPGGIYDVQGQLNEYVEPPAPLLLANKRWEMQDANWFPDFPASAEKILWFYRHSRGQTADGVIALNATVLERILGIIGPIESASRGLALTKNNALTAIQEVVEFGEEKKLNRPKQIISDLTPLFIAGIASSSPDNLMPILTNLHEALAQKEIQLYFTDNRAEKAMTEFGWGGKIISSRENQDYLFVVNTNIQGQKSDALIKQKINHQAVVEEDGTVVNSVVITREHQGVAGERLYGQTNIDYIRLYVPEGSQLVSARGFSWPDEKKFRAPENWYKKDSALSAIEREIGVDNPSGTRVTNEFGKTAFGNWVITEPGQTSQVQFIYTLPFNVFQKTVDGPSSRWDTIFLPSREASHYQLIVQRQSGIESGFESQIIYPDGWNPAWNNGEQMTIAVNGASIENAVLKKDKVWSLVMEKKNAD